MGYKVFMVIYTQVLGRDFPWQQEAQHHSIARILQELLGPVGFSYDFFLKVVDLSKHLSNVLALCNIVQTIPVSKGSVVSTEIACVTKFVIKSEITRMNILYFKAVNVRQTLLNLVFQKKTFQTNRLTKHLNKNHVI